MRTVFLTALIVSLPSFMAGFALKSSEHKNSLQEQRQECYAEIEKLKLQIYNKIESLNKTTDFCFKQKDNYRDQLEQCVSDLAQLSYEQNAEIICMDEYTCELKR